MMTTTPLEAFVCREVIESYFFEERAFSTRRHFIVTTALVVGAMLGACNFRLGVRWAANLGSPAHSLAYNMRSGPCPRAYGRVWSNVSRFHLS